MEMASFKQVQNDKSAWQRLVPTLHAGVEYVPLSALSIGALYSGQFENEGTFSELTASLNFKPVTWFNLSGSYSFVHGKRETVGFAIGFMPAILNLFLACDYTIFKVTKQYIPLNTLTTNFQLGISIPIGRAARPTLSNPISRSF
jgi:opacity protein-like surface antigen